MEYCMSADSEEVGLVQRMEQIRLCTAFLRDLRNMVCVCDGSPVSGGSLAQGAFPTFVLLNKIYSVQKSKSPHFLPCLLSTFLKDYT